MKKIKVYTGYNYRTNTRYYKNFEVVDRLPEVGEIVWGGDYHGERDVVKAVLPVAIDPEQGSDEVWDYEYYAVTIALEEQDDDGEWAEGFEETRYYAVRRKEE